MRVGGLGNFNLEFVATTRLEKRENVQSDRPVLVRLDRGFVTRLLSLALI